MLNIFRRKQKEKDINNENKKIMDDFFDVKIGDTLVERYEGTDVTVFALSKNFPDKILVKNYEGNLAWIHISMLRKKITCAQ